MYEVTLPAPIVVSQGRANVQLEQFGSDQLLLRVVRPGSALLRVRWTPYWYFEGGCVQRDGDWTRISTRNKGFALLSIRFSPERVVQRGRRCAERKARLTHMARRRWLDPVLQVFLFVGAYYAYRLVRGVGGRPRGRRVRERARPPAHRAVARPLLRAGPAGLDRVATGG